MKAVAVILAAGEGKQYGHPKALLEHEGGRSFLRSLSLTFGKAGCTILGVVGHGAEEVRDQHPELILVESPRWAEGQLASAQAGVAAALEEGADVILLHPVDQPAVRPATIKSLLGALGDGEGVVPEYEGAVGFPWVLSRHAADALRQRAGASLEAVLSQLGLRRVATKDPGVVVNVNTPEIYQRLFGEAPKRAPPPKRRIAKKEAE